MTINPYLESFKEVVKDLKYKGVIKTNQDIADKIGMTKGQVSQAMNNGAGLSKNFINKFNAAYNVDIRNWNKSEKPQSDIKPIKVSNTADESIIAISAAIKIHQLELVNLMSKVNGVSFVDATLDVEKKILQEIQSLRNQLGR